MKKIFAFLFALVAILTLTGCSVRKGHYYQYSTFEYELFEDLTTIEKGIAEVAITTAKKGYQFLSFGFVNDEVCFVGNTQGSYTQDGNKITVKCGLTYELVAKGSKLVIEVQEDDYSYTVTFVYNSALNVPEID